MLDPPDFVDGSAVCADLETVAEVLDAEAPPLRCAVPALDSRSNEDRALDLMAVIDTPWELD